MQHNFNIDVATKYGVNIAIFLNNLSFWIQHNIANEKHFYDGRYWSYNSKKSYSKLYPYWSEKQIRTIIDNCKAEGLIIIDNFNKNKYDQTHWYSLTEKACELLNFTICPNGPMVQTKRADESDQKGRPIPDIKPDIKPKRGPARKNREPLSFEPDSKNQELAHRLGVNIETEVKSFISKKPSSKWNQSEFEIWLKHAKEFQDKHHKNEVKSIVQEYGPGHPHWEQMQEVKRYKEQRASMN